MNEPFEFSDEQLTAYLDGEAGTDIRRQIDAARLTDSSLDARLRSLSVDTKELKTSFDSILASAPAAPETVAPVAREDRGPNRAAIMSMAACAAALVFVGVVFGWYVSPGQGDSWQGAAAIYHKLYVKQTLAHVIADTPRQTEELRRVSKALGRTIDLGELTGLSDLEYKRAQVLGYQGRPLVQLAFLTTDGIPVALCIMRAPNTAARGVKGDQIEGLGAASWISDGYEFIVLANTRQARLEKFARHFRSQL